MVLVTFAIHEHQLGSCGRFERLMGPRSLSDSHPLFRSVNTLILMFVQGQYEGISMNDMLLEVNIVCVEASPLPPS